MTCSPLCLQAMCFLCCSMLYGPLVPPDFPPRSLGTKLARHSFSVSEVCPQALVGYGARQIRREQVLCCRKWRVVSHPLNANPFSGSLLNYKAKLRLQDVTVENKTFVQLHCSFQTEHEVSMLICVQIFLFMGF